MKGCIKYLALVILLTIASFYILISRIERVKLPDHLLGHPVHFYENLIDEETFKELNKYIRELGSD